MNGLNNLKRDKMDFKKELAEYGYNLGNAVDVETLIDEILPSLFSKQEVGYSEEEVEILLETLSKVLVYQGNEYRLPNYFENEIKQTIQQFKKK